MTKKFINADELELEYYDLSIHGTMAVKSVLPVFTDLLEKQLTADVVEVRHGEWIDDGDCFHCSDCGKTYHLGSLQTIYDVKRCWKYCSHCGAKMDKGVN